jgi:hypothetical protein
VARISPSLIAKLRAAGLDVREVSGCWGRGSDSFNPVGVIAHATAGSSSATDASELNVILYGSNSAPPPISQFMLGRTGIVYFVADGRCNHVVSGYSGTRFAGLGNSSLIGIEGCNNNLNESWAGSYGAYTTLVRVICQHYGWSVSDRVRGHKEHQPGNKSDPTFNMNTFRANVSAAPQPSPSGDDDMVWLFNITNDPNPGSVYLCVNHERHRYVSSAEYEPLKKSLRDNGKFPADPNVSVNVTYASADVAPIGDGPLKPPTA